MHVTLLFNQISSSPTIDERDVLVQCDAVESALVQLGHRVSQVSLGMNLAEAQTALRQLKPDVVFNLVESVGRTDRLMPLATLLLESMQIPFTGASSHTLLQTSGKIRAKRLLLSANLPTPSWLEHNASELKWNGDTPQRAILKAVWEHASFGMDDSCVIDSQTMSAAEIGAELTRRVQQTGRQWFAEQFIDGREFNLSVIAGSGEPIIMPPAEICFVDFPAGKPRIVNYAAKWHEESSEYFNTPRTFDFTAADAGLLSELEALAVRCWHHFDLRGYARVDFRVDERGQPWVLEINANPCLSPDAGFAAAIQRSGMTSTEAIQKILEDVHD